MSLLNSDLTKLSLKDERVTKDALSEASRQHADHIQATAHEDPIRRTSQDSSENISSPSRLLKVPQELFTSQNSTQQQKRPLSSPFSSFYNSVISTRSGSPVPLDYPAQKTSQATFQTNNHQKNTHLKQAESSTSVNSQLSVPSGSRTPTSSVIELKRFFGKGRNKHEHGITHPETRKKPIFNFFGIVRKAKKVPDSLSDSPISGSSSQLQTESRVKHQKSLKKNKDDPLSIKGGFRKLKHDIRKSQEDSNFVVHAPDYEADWDPFHVFGLAPNSERLPFLESGITKYGEVGKDMGSGAGGSVRMMERPSDNKVFAVKEFRARKPNETLQKYAKHVTAEYALGAALHHKNIIETIDLIKEGDKYFEVMECGPHDFFELVMSSSMTTAQINSSWKQIVNGVAYLHSMGVAHRDLKLDNCVVTQEGVIKLIDFGSAVVFKYPISSQIHLARGIVGSDPYLAPEVFTKHPYQPQVADIWSCGIIYCCTYLRRFPWKIPQNDDPNFRKFCMNPSNIDGRHPPQDNPRKITGPWRLLRLLPLETRDTIQHIMQTDVVKRITMDGILNSDWFKQIEEISVLPSK